MNSAGALTHPAASLGRCGLGLLAVGAWLTISAASVESATEGPCRLPAELALELAGSLPLYDAKDSWLDRQRTRYYVKTALDTAAELEASGNVATAEDLLLQADARAPDHPRVMARLVGLFMTSGRNEEALALAEKLQATFPENAELRLARAYLALEQADPRRALAEFEAGLAGFEGDPTVLVAALGCYGQTAIDTQAYDKALQAATRWLQAEPSPAAHDLAANAAIHRSEWETAARHLRAALAVPADDRTRGARSLKLGYVLTYSGDHPAARTAYLEARDLLTGTEARLEIERQLGQNAFRQRIYDKSADHFRMYLLESFDELVALGYLTSLKQLGKWDLAAVEAGEFLKRENLSESFRDQVVTYLGPAGGTVTRGTNQELERARKAAQEAPTQTNLRAAADAGRKAGKLREILDLYQRALESKFDDNIAYDYYLLLKEVGP